MLRSLFLILLFPASLAAERIIPPSNLFRDPKFVKDFVGSYGFLSDVEPKVSQDEQALLVKVRELFDSSRFREAEQEVVRFIKETENPTDPEKQPAEISPALVFVLGNLYFQADRTEDARRAFLEAIRRFPRFRRAHTNLAYLFISKNQTDEAMPMLQKAIELEPRVRAARLLPPAQEKRAGRGEQLPPGLPVGTDFAGLETRSLPGIDGAGQVR